MLQTIYGPHKHPANRVCRQYLPLAKPLVMFTDDLQPASLAMQLKNLTILYRAAWDEQGMGGISIGYLNNIL